MSRQPYTEPYTRRERVAIRYDLMRDDLRRFCRDGIWRWVALRLPRRLALWAFIRVSACVTDRPPDEITYPVAYKEWERRMSA